MANVPGALSINAKNLTRSILLPSTEWPPEDNVLNDLRETARNISRELGATAWPPPRSGG